MRSRRPARPLAAAVLTAVAVGCAARVPALHDPDAWSRAVRHRGLDPDAVSNPIGVTPVIAEAARAMGGRGTPLEILDNLQEALFFGSRMTFDYESTATLTAGEALAAGRGNCVAFTNLFIALGRARGIQVRGALIELQDRSERRGDLVFVNNHVVAVYPHTSGITVYDFYRQRSEFVSQIRLLDDLELAAIYANNRGALELQRSNPAGAAAAFETTVRLWPDFSRAYANLGVARRRLGDADGAFEAYRRALRDAPRDPTVLGNLAALYTSLGKEGEAKAALAAADLRGATPWLLVVRADLELAEGNVDEAARLYRKAARQAPGLAEAFFGLARAEEARGNERASRQARERAEALIKGPIPEAPP